MRLAQAEAATALAPGARKPRLLFVDDDDQVLAGLANVLRRERRRWDMVFAVGGEAGLAELAKGPFDVVVSDMRMPGMDGATFLARVQQEQPGTARIVLSGYAERECLARTLTVAHQFLSKPCEGALLRSTLERAADATTLLATEPVLRLARELGTLPAAPPVYAELLGAMNDTHCDMQQVAEIVARDPATSAKVLGVAQSGFFGGVMRIDTVQQAVQRLGLEVLESIVLAMGTAQAFHASRSPCLDLDAIQSRSTRAARIARNIAPSPELAQTGATAALLHDVGLIVLGTQMPAACTNMQRRAQEEGRPLHEIERDELGVTHAEIGAYLLATWGVSLAIVEAVAKHHDPRRAPHDPLVALVHVATALACATTDDDVDAGIDPEIVAAARASGQRDRWLAAVAQESS